MKVLVLGGTGVMGESLNKFLSDKGVDVFVTSRSYRSNIKNIRYIQGNAQDLVFLKSILNQHWDAIVDFMVYSSDNFKNRIDLLLKSTSQYLDY